MGYDSTSAFGGKEKIAGLKLIMKNESYCNVFARLGEQRTLSPELLSQLKRFTCKMYATKMEVTNTNKLRMQLFKSRKVEMGQLPPCEDCLNHRAVRANYQARI